eukprot:48648_1
MTENKVHLVLVDGIPTCIVQQNQTQPQQNIYLLSSPSPPSVLPPLLAVVSAACPLLPGALVGVSVGLNVGDLVGTDDGIDVVGVDVVGIDVGIDVGTVVGTDVGIDVGIDVGTVVGTD